MISDALIQFGVAIVQMVCGWFPKEPGVDQVVVSAGGYLGPIIQGAASLGVWVPWGVIGVCVSVVVPLYMGTLIFKALRAVLSYVPMFGGAG